MTLTAAKLEEMKLEEIQHLEIMAAQGFPCRVSPECLEKLCLLAKKWVSLPDDVKFGLEEILRHEENKKQELGR